MHSNFIFNDINDALPALSGALLDVGQENGSRNGTVKEFTHVGITLKKPWQREIQLSDRRANIAAQIAETAWVLAGRNDIEFLSHYLPRAKDYSDDGTTWRAGYGPRIRRWADGTGMGHTDQLQYVVDTLRDDPLSRQAVIGIWDPAVDTLPGKDRACNDLLIFTSRLGYLDLQVCVRSNDLIWGFSGVNTFEWSVLQEIVAGMLGIYVGALHFSTSSLHLYEPHWAKARKIADAHEHDFGSLIGSPRFNATGFDDTESLDYMLNMWFDAEERIRTRHFTANDLVEDFPEPMFQSWLRVLQWWWTGDHSHLKPLGGTRLEYATHVAMQPPIAEGREAVERVLGKPSAFIQYAIKTHNEKHAAYGDSWKKRGEMLGIMANIARKIDRLGGAETSDETSADTAMDLMVYLCKYQTWIQDPSLSETPDLANKIMESMDRNPAECTASRSALETVLKMDFDRLEGLVVDGNGTAKAALVKIMAERAYFLAVMLWGSDDYRGADAD